MVIRFIFFVVVCLGGFLILGFWFAGVCYLVVLFFISFVFVSYDYCVNILGVDSYIILSWFDIVLGII